MPIYMDRHDVSPEVTAEIVADLHQKDLKIQHKFNCTGLTYWFDNKRKTAFCLIEAPSEAALREMHAKAHGEVPNRIIEVDPTVVESFLGRIEDPEKSRKTELNIINDSAFRTIMIVGVKPCSLRETLDKKINSLKDGQYKMLIDKTGLFHGKFVKQNPEYFLVSFDSVTNAVLCALKFLEEFEGKSGNEKSSSIKLKIGLNAGIPVDVKEGFFEDTIKTAHSYFDLVGGTLILSPEVKALYDNENLHSPITSESVVILTPSEEKFLKDLVLFIEKEWNNPSLHANDFSRYLGFSKSGFYRKLTALTGKSPNIFLKDFKMCKALELLKKKNLNISEVAFETGFNSPAYFSKCFQESFGVLPSEYISKINY